MPAARRAPPSLLRSIGHYLAGNALQAASGLVSFPLMTRLLGPGDYGLLGLVTFVLLLVTAAAKLGFQEGVVRFYPAHRRDGTVPVLVSTVVVAGVGTSVLAMLLSGAGGLLVLRRRGADLALALLAASFLAGARPLSRVLLSLLRAREASRAYNTLETLGIWAGMVLGLLGALFFEGQRLSGLLLGFVAGEGAVLALVWASALKGQGFRPGRARAPVLRSLLAYGMPFVAFEVTSVALAYADRALVAAFLGDRELGLYTAAYNLANQGKTFFILPLAMASAPVLMRRFEEGGAEAASAFLGRVHRGFCLVALPAAAGVLVVGGDLLRVLAGPSYAAAGHLVGIVFASALLHGAHTYLAAGLLLARRTWVFTLHSGVAVAVNLLLNLVLIPRLGITGAGLATAVCYLGVLVSLSLAGRRHLSVPLAATAVARYAAGALLAAGVAAAVRLAVEPPALRLGLAVAAAAVVYAAFACAVDPGARAFARTLLRAGSPPPPAPEAAG